MTEIDKPGFATEDELDEMLGYLDVVKESCVINMFGAAPYLRDEFPELSKRESREVVAYWMKTFGERHKEN